jgi:hypothetical protein
MNEWIDFFVYAAQAVSLWVFFPRWATGFTVSWMMDRNAAWVAANPRAIDGARPGGWFLHACYAWAVVSILVLLVFRLQLQPASLFPRSLQMPVWAVLMAVNNALLALGMIGYASGAGVFLAWLQKTVPMSDTRQATLQPRTGEGLVPAWFRNLVLFAVGAHLLAWLIVGIAGHYQKPQFWGAFAMINAMALIGYIVGRYSVMRRPGQMDRILGASYRRTEVCLAYAMQLLLVSYGAIAICKLVLDIDARRFSQLGTTLFVVGAIAYFTWTARRQGGNLQHATHA